jgi:hypothetical protein
MQGANSDSGWRPSRLTFPSDSVTIADIRRSRPDIAESLSDPSIKASDIAALHALSIEIHLAKTAFAKAAHIPAPPSIVSRDEQVDMLNRIYLELGLSAGMRCTKEFVKLFEKEAEVQARSKGRNI